MTWYQLLWSFTWRVGLIFGAAWLTYRYLHLAVAMLIIPIAGRWLAPSLINGMAEFFGWAARQPLEAWQGKYYAFNGIHMRFFEVRGELWLVDHDLLRIVDMKATLLLESQYDRHEYDDIADTRFQGFSPQGAEKFLRAQQHPEAGKAMLWLKREVYAVHARRRERGL